MEEQMRRGSVIAVFSTASAVGKTLVSINMAAELSRLGYKVCLVDMDLQFGDVCNYLQLEPNITIADAVAELREDSRSFNVMDFVDMYQYRRIEFAVMASPLNLGEAYTLQTSDMQQVLQQLQLNFDFLVIDTTSAFSETNLMVMDMSTIITFLGIVDFIPTIKNMKIGCDTLRNLGYDFSKIRLVLNRSNSKTKIDLEDVKNTLGESFYHILANDFEAAWDATMEGVPLVATSKTELAQDLRELVAKYMNIETEEEEADDDTNAGVFSKIKRLFG